VSCTEAGQDKLVSEAMNQVAGGSRMAAWKSILRGKSGVKRASRRTFETVSVKSFCILLRVDCPFSLEHGKGEGNGHYRASGEEGQ